MKGTLILLVVMFGAGLGLGYLLGNSQDTITRAEPARSATRPAPGADDLVVPEGGYRSLGDAIGTVPALRGETGHGIITGKVTNEEGDPIAGAVIRASQRFASSWRGTTWQVGDGAPEPRSLETQVRTFIARQKRVERAGREAVTDADGNYQLDDLADAEYTLAAYARGYKIEPAAGQRRNKARPGETVDFTAAAVVEIPITLQMPGGASTEGVSISTRNLDNQRTEWRSWNARRSSLRVKPGHYEISASKGNELKSHKVELTAEFGVPVEPIVLTLHGRPGIRGRIIFEEGELMGWTQVRLLRMTDAKMPRATRLRKHGKRASARGGGEYSFPDLKPGRYVLGVEIGSRVVGLTQVEVADRVVEQDIRLGTFDPAEFVVIHVFDPKGKRITDAKFSTSFESGNASSSGGGTAVRRKDGGYYVPHHDSSNIDAGGDEGTYSVTITSKKYGAKKISYQLGKQGEFTVRFTAPGTLVVTLDGYTDEIEGAFHLSLAKKGDTERHYSHFGQDQMSEGKQTFGPMEPGEYILTLLVKTDEHWSLPASKTPVTVRAGENAASMSLPTLHTLTVIADDHKGKQLQLKPTSTKGYVRIQAKVGDDGKAVFERLPPGKYEVSDSRGMQRGAMKITIPGPAVVRYEPVEQNAFRITIRDVTGNLAAAGFHDGDLIIGVDGTEFETAMQAQTTLMAAMAKDSSKIIILRGGARHTLSVDFKKLMEIGWDKMGGRFEPASR